MEKTKIKIGYLPTRRNVFSAEDAQAHKNQILESIRMYDAEVVDINDINSEGLIFDLSDIDKIVEKFKAAGVDGIFAPHCNFGSEALVAKVCKAIGKPVLLWGPRDDAPLASGARSRDTQCGLFATGKILRRFNVPFTYLVNSKVEDPVFVKGYNNFLAVCSVVKAFGKIKILQIAPRPDAFWTMICNEGELLERFGVEVFPITMQAVKLGTERILKEKGPLFQKNREVLTTKINCSRIKDSEVDNLVALKTLMNEYCDEQGCTAVAIQCWNDLQTVLGIMPCVANGLMTDEGIPVMCETDIHGAICSIMLQEAVRRTTPIFFADLTIRHPENDNAELLWHCGNFPPSLVKGSETALVDYNFIMPDHCPGTGEFEIKGGDITICRFDGDHGEYSLLIGEGKGVDGPKNKGTYVWFEVKDWPMWEEKIVTGPYVHHCAGVHGKVAAVLHEACKYIPGLNPDPVEPTAEEIASYWRSND